MEKQTRATIVSTINIVPVSDTHIKALFTIDSSTSSHPWNKEQFGSELRFSGVCGFCAMTGEYDVIGFVLGRRGSDEFEITKIAVVQQFQQCGIGTKLINTLLRHPYVQQASTMYLEVSEANSAAIRLYKRIGFNTRYRREKYYTNTSNALVMSMAVT